MIDIVNVLNSVKDCLMDEAVSVFIKCKEEGKEEYSINCQTIKSVHLHEFVPRISPYTILCHCIEGLKEVCNSLKNEDNVKPTSQFKVFFNKVDLETCKDALNMVCEMLRDLAVEVMNTELRERKEEFYQLMLSPIGYFDHNWQFARLSLLAVKVKNVAEKIPLQPQ